MTGVDEIEPHLPPQMNIEANCTVYECCDSGPDAEVTPQVKAYWISSAAQNIQGSQQECRGCEKYRSVGGTNAHSRNEITIWKKTHEENGNPDTPNTDKEVVKQ